MLILAGLPSWGQAPTAQITAKTEEIAAPPPIAPIVMPRGPVSERLATQTRQLLAGVEAPPHPVWISVQGEKVLGFWHADTSGTPVGAILMVHDQGHSPRRPDTLLNLHRVMPRHGWATLSIEMPTLRPATTPAREHTTTASPTSLAVPNEDAPQAQTERTEASVDETQVVHQEEDPAAKKEPAAATPKPAAPKPTAEEIEQMAMATLQAGLDYLQQQNQFNIVILGEGLGAARALKFVAQAEVGSPPAQASGGTRRQAVISRPVRALVLLNADLSKSHTEAPLELIRYPEVPTLDLITSVDFEVRANAARRKQMSQKMQYQIYSLRRLMPQAGDNSGDQENDVTKNIRGFVTKHAQGVKL